MNRRTIRIGVLVLVNLVLLGRIVYVGLTRDVQVRVPDLIDRQIIQRDDLNANTCERAVILASNPDATPADTLPADIIDPQQATLISSATLENHYKRDIAANAITTAPMLLEVDAFNEERLVWGQLWLYNHGMATRESAVTYVDARAAVPLLLFTDVRVKDAAHESCVAPVQANYHARFRAAAPLIWGVAMMFISVGLVLDYRSRVARFTLHKRR